MNEEYYQKIINEVRNLPDKKEFLPGIYAVPINISPSMKEYIHTKIVTRMCKPLQTIFKMYNLSWRNIISIFSTVDVEIEIWNLYDVNKFNERMEKDPQLLDLYAMMDEKVNLNKLFKSDDEEVSFDSDDEENNINSNIMIPTQSKQVEKYLKFTSNVKISDKRAAIIHVDFYKDCGVDTKVFFDNLVSSERNTLLSIYLNELISFLTRVYKYENSVLNYLKLNLVKMNKKLKAYVSKTNEKVPNDIYEEIKNTVVKCFNSYLLNKNIISSLDRGQSDIFKKFLENPFSFTLSFFDSTEINNMKNGDTLTILEIAEYIAKKAEFIFSPESDNEDDSNKLIGMKIQNRTYVISQMMNGSDDSNSERSRADDLNDAFDNTISKMRGFGCKDILSALGAPIETEVDWCENILKKIVTTYQNKSSKTEFTWSKPNILTKHIATLPSALKYGLNIKVHFAIDSSGSMTDEDLEKANFIIKFLVDKSIPVVIYVHDYGDDVKIFKCETQDEFDVFSKYRYRSGGTSHEGVFRKIEENLKTYSERKKAIIVIFSDLYSDINECYHMSDITWPKIAPTYFVTRTRHMNPCFGETIIIQ